MTEDNKGTIQDNDDDEIKAFKVKTEDKEEKGESNKGSGGEEQGGCGKSQCCILTLDIIHTVCLYLMSIFFLTGSLFAYPRFLMNTTLSEPLVFIFLGTLFYIAAASIEVFKTKQKGVLAITLSSVALFGGVLWFIGSIFLFRRIQNNVAFSSLWLLGSLCNLVFLTFGIVKTLLPSSGPKPLFHTIALGLSWTSNLLFLAGAAHNLAINSGLNNGLYTQCAFIDDVGDFAGLFLSASIIYLVHAIFHTLSLFKGGLKFKVEYVSS